MFEKDFHRLIVNEALYELKVFLSLAKKQKYKVVGLIVGYGSSGKTHKIKTAFLEELDSLKNKKYIKDYIKGEDLDLFNSRYLNFKYRELLPEEIKKHPNKGEIYVVL